MDKVETCMNVIFVMFVLLPLIGLTLFFAGPLVLLPFVTLVLLAAALVAVIAAL